MNFTDLSQKKKLPTYELIPLNSIQIFKEIISRDEGGWFLEVGTGDDDGGWTYGGMTKKTFEQYFSPLDAATIASWQDEFHISDDSGDEESNIYRLRQAILTIYHQEYYIPLLPLLHADAREPFQYEVSCAVNCGVSYARSFLTSSLAVTGKGTDGQKKEFLERWKEHYFDIFKGNPEHWAKYIHGWINRVWYYI